jgi:hypothetical protein
VWIIPQRPRLDLAWIDRFARWLRRERIDVLHTLEFEMNAFGGVAAVLTRVHSLSSIHDKHGIPDLKRRAIAHRGLRRAGVPIVTVSENLPPLPADRRHVPRARLQLVHNRILSWQSVRYWSPSATSIRSRIA